MTQDNKLNNIKNDFTSKLNILKHNFFNKITEIRKRRDNEKIEEIRNDLNKY